MSELSGIINAATELLVGVADKKGISLDGASLEKYADQVTQLVVDLIDGHAKQHAAAAGKAAADKITTLAEAEESEKKP